VSSFSSCVVGSLDLFLGNAKRFRTRVACMLVYRDKFAGFRNSKFLSVRNSKNRISTFLPTPSLLRNESWSSDGTLILHGELAAAIQS
jgi:hypothetical protein